MVLLRASPGKFIARQDGCFDGLPDFWQPVRLVFFQPVHRKKLTVVIRGVRVVVNRPWVIGFFRLLP